MVDTSGMGLGLFEVVDSEGHRVMSCPNRGPSAAAAPFLAPLPRTTQPTNLFVAALLADQPRYGYPCQSLVGQTWLVRGRPHRRSAAAMSSTRPPCSRPTDFGMSTGSCSGS
jgi:hypothetical protein